MRKREFYESNDVVEDDRKKEERNTKVPIECDNSSVCFYTPWYSDAKKARAEKVEHQV